MLGESPGSRRNRIYDFPDWTVRCAPTNVGVHQENRPADAGRLLPFEIEKSVVEP